MDLELGWAILWEIHLLISSKKIRLMTIYVTIIWQKRWTKEVDWFTWAMGVCFVGKYRNEELVYVKILQKNTLSTLSNLKIDPIHFISKW